MNVIALDLSSTSTGVCHADGTTTVYKPKGKTVLDRARATALLVVDLHYCAGECLWVIEDIATRFTQTAIAIAYVHCLVDLELSDERTLKVAPTVLKKFATGKGNAQKDAMIAAAIRAGSDAETNDAADAWWLWALGRHLVGSPVVDTTAYRSAVVDSIAWDTAA